MYGEQNQRSYSVGVSDFGSRSASASAGFVSALMKSVRNCPGCPEYCCANDSGTRIALSSASPVDAIPVIDQRRCQIRRSALGDLDLFPDRERSRILRGERSADDDFVRAVAEPAALYLPRWVRGLQPGFKTCPVRHRHFVFVPRADHCGADTAAQSLAHPETA